MCFCGFEYASFDSNFLAYFCFLTVLNIWFADLGCSEYLVLLNFLAVLNFCFLAVLIGFADLGCSEYLVLVIFLSFFNLAVFSCVLDPVLVPGFLT
jgi:hypothetical protein